MKRFLAFLFVVLPLLAVAQTNHGVGSIVVDCDGKQRLQWKDVGCFALLQRTEDMTNWSNVLVAAWMDCSTKRAFSIPLVRSEDKEFFRLISYDLWRCDCFAQ